MPPLPPWYSGKIGRSREESRRHQMLVRVRWVELSIDVVRDQNLARCGPGKRREGKEKADKRRNVLVVS